MRWLVVLLLLPLAGCLGGPTPSTAVAKEAVEISQAAVDARYEYALFLGVTGTEGDLDWAGYEQDLIRKGGQGAHLARAFDQDLPNGAFGDGRLGGWMTMHFAYDEERRLVGGLYAQVLADGSRRALLAPFVGPYAGAHAMAAPYPTKMVPGLDLAAGTFAGETPQNAPVLCALETHTRDWNITSEVAAAIARSTPAMQAHMEAYPGGELTYFYFPRLGVEAGCPAELDTPSNLWTIVHTDLDRYLAGEVPSMTQVVIDAGDGRILSTMTGPLATRAPEILDEVVAYTDPLLPSRQRHEVPVEVYDDATLLEIQSLRTARPTHASNEWTELVAPDGRVVADHDFATPLHRYVIEDPDAGTWTLRYTYTSGEPGGGHVLELRGAVVYG